MSERLRRERLVEGRDPGVEDAVVHDDNVVNQLVARRVLEKRGHTVVVANNGLDALARLEAATFAWFSCVLMDVQLPRMDGFRVHEHHSQP